MASLTSKLKAFVDGAQDISELTALIPHGIPLPTAKRLLRQHIDASNSATIHAMYFASVPLHRILSSDVMQMTLTFLPYQRSLAFVNKHFNALVSSNAVIAKGQRQRDIASHFEGDGVWVVDANRDHLTADEVQKGYKGLFQSLQKALDSIESGHQILLRKGRHKIHGGSFGDKDVRIHGDGSGHCIIAPDVDPDLRNFATPKPICVESKVSLKNIRFEEKWSELFVTPGNTLWMTNCVVEADNSVIRVGSGLIGDFGVAKLDLFGVKIVGTDERIGAIQLEEDSVLCAVYCLFDGCEGNHGFDGTPCIQLPKRSEATETISLRLGGNEFRNIELVPIRKFRNVPERVELDAIKHEFGNNLVNGNTVTDLFDGDDWTY